MIVKLDDVHSLIVNKSGDDCYVVEMTEQCADRVIRFPAENYSAGALEYEFGVKVG